MRTKYMYHFLMRRQKYHLNTCMDIQHCYSKSAHILRAFAVNAINSFKPKGISHSNQLNQSICVLKDVGIFQIFQILIEYSVAKSKDPGQTFAGKNNRLYPMLQAAEIR